MYSLGNFIGRLARIILSMVIVFSAFAVAPVFATQKTFDAGSYIIGADSCWQPNNDTNTSVEICGNGIDDNKNGVVDESSKPGDCYPANYCDPNKNDKSLFQLYGLLYSLLDTGDQPDNCINNDGSSPQQKSLFGYCKQIKVNWIIDSTKSDANTPDLTITGSVSPLVSVSNSAGFTGVGSSTSPVYYKGGPFVIDVNDLTAAEFSTLKSKFPSVKIHKANVPFSGNVDKILIGKPPKIAVLNEGASDVLENYIRAAGQFAWKNVVFQYVNARDIIAGCLQNPVPTSCTSRRSDITAPFQLLWAPHWVIEDKWSGESTTPSAADQTKVVQEIRAFLEKGSSGFFECASIESLEGSLTAGSQVAAGAAGFLTGSSNTWPRLDINGGCSDTGNCSSNYVKQEEAPFWLSQCGGWNYGATGGHVHNMRPTMSKNYLYLTTKGTDDAATTPDDRFIGTQLTRFLHDDPTKLNGSYTPSSNYYTYDYLVGGRINGAPTQGYVVYFPGHKYIDCTNTTTFTAPPARNLEFQFSGSSLPANSKIYIELVHAACTQGSTCPKVSFDTGPQKGQRISDSRVDLSAEFANYSPDTNTLSGVYFASTFDDTVATQFQISNIYVTFDGSSGTKLDNVADLTEPGKRLSLCAPNATSSLSPATPVVCSAYNPTNVLSLQFTGDISTDAGKTVTVAIPSGPTATYDLQTAVGTSSTVGNMTLDLSGATYDAAGNSLRNVKVRRGNTCADLTISDLTVTFPGSGIKLIQVYNETTNEAVCAPGGASPASCSGYVAPPSATTDSIQAQLQFKNAYTNPNPTTIALKIDYTCGTSCSGNLTATYNTNSPPGASATASDTLFRIDMAAAKFDSKNNKTLQNIILTNLDKSKTLTITKVTVTYDKSKVLQKFSDTTNTATIYDYSKDTVASPMVSKALTYNLVGKPPVAPPSTWSHTFGAGICSYYISPYLSSCTVNWNASNTCGIKYVLNTFLALKFQVTSSEFTKTQPIVKDNILFKSSFDYPIYRGHLKMMKVPTDTLASAVTLWDAATAMPMAGISGFPASPLSSLDTTSPRYIFTNQPGTATTINFDPAHSASLKTYLGVSTDDDATVLINTVRGRTNASKTDVYGSTSDCGTTPNGSISDDLYGCGEDTKRLWAIENSTPAMKVRSKYVEKTASVQSAATIAGGRDRRDRFLITGADDGMLHAFWAGSWDSTTSSYPDTNTGNGTGKEIWAYIPSSLMSQLKAQPFIPDPADDSSFEPKVAVDGSPALGDFLVCTSTDLNGKCTKWEWKTRTVGTAMVRSQNRGIVFALDVTDPYTPQVLWENTYDKTTDVECKGSLKNCNMGNSKGVAIGTVQTGPALNDYVFLTSSWLKKKNPADYAQDCAVNAAGCVYGVSAYALDLSTGNVVWEKKLPYTGDAIDVNVTPAIPALMDKDNNGSYDYVVFGDFQGRLWALRTTDGENLTGNNPVYEVKVMDNTGKDTAVAKGAAEPIGAAVSTYRDYVVFGTGGADYASDTASYHVQIVKIGINGATKDDSQTLTTDPGEKIWAKPVITSDLKVFVATAKSFYSDNMTHRVSTLQSSGRITIIDLRIKKTETEDNIKFVGGVNQWISGGFVGGIDVDRKHAYAVALRPSADASGKNSDVIQVGANDFTSSKNKSNPYKILWWRKL